LIDLTVLIASYETRELLLSCLDSVEAARRAHPELGVETLVVDNASSDGTVVAIREDFPDVRVFALVRNRGFAAAVNLGLRASRGRSILLLNSDVEIDEDLLAGGVRILDENSQVGVVGAALLHPDGRAQRSVHALPGLQTELLPEFVLRSFRPAAFAPRAGAGLDAFRTGLREVEAIRGAVFFFRASLLEKVGALNEGFFFFLEETEYCARVRRAGYRILHAEALRAVHHLGASSKRVAPLATRIEYHRSLYRFLLIERGSGVARLARGLRTLRGGLLILGMIVLFPISASVRRRMPERWGLLLWHLQGCPDEPGLADVLETARARPRESGRKAIDT
jgi:GT2 family glycosyltransferase